MMNNLPQRKIDEALSISRVVALRGECKKRVYGCVITTESGEIIGVGCTSSPTPCTKCKRAHSRKGRGYDNCPSIHAEQMALLSCDTTYAKYAFLSCFDKKTMKEVPNPSPCPTCAKLLKHVGIDHVITVSGVIEI